METTHNEFLVLGLSIFIVVFILAIIRNYLNWKQFKNTTFKVAKIDDNLGNFYYCIVARNSKGNFQELSNFKFYNTSKLKLGRHKFLSHQEAEKQLNFFLIDIGQIQYKKNIEII